ncbi:TPA: hypothetical protein PC598_002820 [Morganella morganii]|nr:hypothetical protein [Morganella morganii]
MGKLLFILGLLIGGSGVFLYHWVKPETYDPYFFLSPKIAEGHPINVPIKLYKKGDTVNFTFWKTPFPEFKLLYLFPVSPPSSRIVLNINEDSNKKFGFDSSEIFNGKGPIKDRGNYPIFKVKLYKINADMTEHLVLDKIHKNNSARRINAFSIAPVPEEYGQYRLEVTVLGDWPELEIDGMDYFITVETYFIK